MNENLYYDGDGVQLTELSEGCRLVAYQDASPRRIWTIGVGHTGPDVYDGLTITQADADELLRRDVHYAELGVKIHVKVPLSQHQFDALVDFCFNLGVEAFHGSTLLAKLNAGDVEGADEEFSRWNKAGGQVLAGLTKRRAAEAALFAS